MWFYHSNDGRLYEDESFVGRGYSGIGVGKNNPDAEDQPCLGPIPRGLYMIGRPFTSPKTGPLTMRLIPDPTTEIYGRSGFEIHGESSDHPGEASHGCIVLYKPFRARIADSGDNLLTVL